MPTETEDRTEQEFYDNLIAMIGTMTLDVTEVAQTSGEGRAFAIACGVVGALGAETKKERDLFIAINNAGLRNEQDKARSALAKLAKLKGGEPTVRVYNPEPA